MTKFELRYALRQPPEDGDDLRGRYDACIDQCRWADRVGFDAVILSEHHGSPDGYMPSPMVLGAAIASATKALRIRFLSLIAPLHNPVRLAEDLATLDIISNGRLDAGLSAGYVGTEFEAMGTSLTNRRAYMDEIVPFLRSAWSGEPFEWKGRAVCVRPRPVQRPGPPIWMGGASEAAARRAARYADVFYPARRGLYDLYLEERKKLGRPPPPPRGRTLLVWVAEDPERFWNRFGRSALHENNAYGRWYEDWKSWNGYVSEEDVDSLRASGRYPVMTPDQLVDAARKLGSEGRLMLHPMAGGFDPDLAWESLELVADRVMPALRSQ